MRAEVYEKLQKEFTYGFANNKRWIRGTVPVSRNKNVYVDTVSGEGVEEILSVLNKFITYQATKVNFPSYSKEDVAQEIRLLALEAIPKYDLSKKTNMITFLQNHINNRIINLCKYVSEKRRKATYTKNEIFKVKCPECKSFTRVRESATSLTCRKCSFTADASSSVWRKYNLPVVTIPFGSINSTDQSEVADFIELISNTDPDLSFVREMAIPLETQTQLRFDFFKVYSDLDEINKKIILMVIEGYTYKDIASAIGISEQAAYTKASKLLKSSAPKGYQ